VKLAGVAGLVLSLGVGFWSQDNNWATPHALVSLEDSIYFRGEAALTGGKATISLPAGFEKYTKVTGRTVQVTCVGGFSPLYVSHVEGGQFTVSTTPQGNAAQQFFWEVKAGCAPGGSNQ
jgi:hypothetical protein